MSRWLESVARGVALFIGAQGLASDKSLVFNRLDERVPTVSFTVDGKDPEKIADALGNLGFYVWNGHNYALAIVERMGLLEAGGMIRVGPVHYNTLGEIERFGEALREVAK